MSRRDEHTDLLQRALDVQLRYYEDMGRLTVDYIEAFGDMFRSDDADGWMRHGRGRGWRRSRTHSGEHGYADEPRRYASPPPPQARAAAPAAASAIVLEAESGAMAVGVFLVENSSPDEVSSPITSTVFQSPAGVETAPELKFEPETVTLAPGEQLLVQVAATIDPTLEEGTSYRGALSVPGLRGTELPIVLRRRGSHQP